MLLVQLVNNHSVQFVHLVRRDRETVLLARSAWTVQLANLHTAALAQTVPLGATQMSPNPLHVNYVLLENTKIRLASKHVNNVLLVKNPVLGKQRAINARQEAHQMLSGLLHVQIVLLERLRLLKD